MILTSTNSIIRILVADNEPESRAAIAALIRGFRYECDEATDGYEAAKMLGRHQYRAVIADAGMPGSCTSGLLDAADEVARGVQFILVARSGDYEAARSHVGSQVRACLQKPVRLEHLRKAIEDILLFSREMTSR